MAKNSRFAVVTCILLLAAGMLAGPFAFSAPDDKQSALAPVPPMGWNSWDSYGTAVREENVRANADAMARDLAKFG